MAKRKKAEDESWLEGEGGEAATIEDVAAVPVAKGRVENKSGIMEWTGLAAATVERTFQEGAPIISKGTRKQGYRINSAAWFDWYWRQKVAEATGSPEAKSFDTAKRREKEAQATLREIEIQQKIGTLCLRSDVNQWIESMYGEYRTRLLSLPSQVTGLTPDQRDQLDEAIHGMLSELSEATEAKKAEGPTDDGDETEAEDDFDFDSEGGAE